jgi:hypothetical protein
MQALLKEKDIIMLHTMMEKNKMYSLKWKMANILQGWFGQMMLYSRTGLKMVLTIGGSSS